MRTSYSAIETYLLCPQKYKFQEIDRIRPPKSREALFGTLVHSALKYMFQKDPLYPTFDEVVSFYREHFPPLETFNQEAEHDPLKRPWTDEERQAYFEEGVRMLRNFYERNAPWNFTVLDLESRFEISLTDEKTGEVHILAGVIDRIDKVGDDTYEIIDYKTARRMPSQDAIDKNLQLALYSLGLQKRWPHIAEKDITLSLYFLKHGEKLSTHPTPDTTKATQEHMLTTIREIEERVREQKGFEPTPNPLCDWCAFRPMCPAWKHLYRKEGGGSMKKEDAEEHIQEYFKLRKERDATDARLKEVQKQIGTYMDQEGYTRVFGTEGYISKKKIERYTYNMEKIKSILEPLGKWEAILKADETKLKTILKQIPENAREKIREARSVARQYTVMTASEKKIKDLEPSGSRT